MEKILFFDIDGTLGVHGKVTPSNLNALRSLKENGYKTFICTGRAPFYAKRLFEGIVSGIVCCNGRYIIYNNEKLYGHVFSNDDLNEYLSMMDEINVGAMLVSDDQAMAYHLNDKEIMMIQKEYGKDKIIGFKDLPVYTFDMFYKDQIHYQQMVEQFKDKLVINDHGGIGNCDCSTIGFDKGDAIAYLLKYFHISKDNAYAFGDGYNDQAMFREAGHCIAMGNAVDVLKEKATYITDDFDKDGIMKALIHEKLL